MTPYDAGTPIPVASRLSNQLVSTDGVVFSSSAPYVPVLKLGAGHATSGVNGIGGATTAGTIAYDFNSPITISFWDPNNPSAAATTDFVSIKGDQQPIASQFATLTAYNLQNQMITSINHNDAAGQDWTISAPDIHAVVWSGNSTADPFGGGIALDDLTFNPVTPEPGTFGLAMAGAAICATARRRRQHKWSRNAAIFRDSMHGSEYAPE